MNTTTWFSSSSPRGWPTFPRTAMEVRRKGRKPEADTCSLSRTTATARTKVRTTSATTSCLTRTHTSMPPTRMEALGSTTRCRRCPASTEAYSLLTRSCQTARPVLWLLHCLTPWAARETWLVNLTRTARKADMRMLCTNNSFSSRFRSRALTTLSVRLATVCRLAQAHRMETTTERTKMSF